MQTLVRGIQVPLFSDPVEPHFDGATIEPTLDNDRLTGQLKRVWNLMQDEKWRTLREIQQALGGIDSEAAISARLRDFRKAHMGSKEVKRRRRGEASRGLFEYQVIAR